MTPRGSITFNRRYRTRLRPLWRIGECLAVLDVFLLILFFILLASSVTRISGIRVNLPQSDVPLTSGFGRTILTIIPPVQSGGECRIYFRDRQITLEQLRRDLVSGSRREKVLIIRADKDIPAGVLSQVIGIAEAARMESFIAVQPLKSRSETRFE
ncbi:MAG: biopolymer transporter ExbD [Lentisphaeria bacterium]|nr:biopolymer transporter ExbD [Lentisphaeria bacterium]MBR2720988.1 biopolymer transporter ExbD [Lentisphaeria bacterium]